MEGFTLITNLTQFHTLTAELLDKSGLRVEITTIENNYRTSDKSIYKGRLVSDARVDHRIDVKDIDRIIEILEALKKVLSDK